MQVIGRSCHILMEINCQSIDGTFEFQLEAGYSVYAGVQMIGMKLMHGRKCDPIPFL